MVFAVDRIGSQYFIASNVNDDVFPGIVIAEIAAGTAAEGSEALAALGDLLAGIIIDAAAGICLGPFDDHIFVEINSAVQVQKLFAFGVVQGMCLIRVLDQDAVADDVDRVIFIHVFKLETADEPLILNVVDFGIALVEGVIFSGLAYCDHILRRVEEIVLIVIRLFCAVVGKDKSVLGLVMVFTGPRVEGIFKRNQEIAVSTDQGIGINIRRICFGKFEHASLEIIGIFYGIGKDLLPVLAVHIGFGLALDLQEGIAVNGNAFLRKTAGLIQFDLISAFCGSRKSRNRAADHHYGCKNYG